MLTQRSEAHQGSAAQHEQQGQQAHPLRARADQGAVARVAGKENAGRVHHTRSTWRQPNRPVGRTSRISSMKTKGTMDEAEPPIAGST